MICPANITRVFGCAWSGGYLLPVLVYFSVASVIAATAVIRVEETRRRAI